MVKGADLIRLWKIDAQQARYNDKGKFYRVLTRFPAALCDPNGFVRFTQRQYETCDRLEIGVRLNVKGAGITKVDGYKTVAKSLRVKSPKQPPRRRAQDSK
jgi:hypothetical protein